MASTASEIWKQTDCSNKESICPQCNFLFTLEWHLMLCKGQKTSEYYFSYINSEKDSILLQKPFISTESVQMLA